MCDSSLNPGLDWWWCEEAKKGIIWTTEGLIMD